MQKDDKAQAKTGVRPLRSGRQTGMPAPWIRRLKFAVAKDKATIASRPHSVTKLRAFVALRTFVVRHSRVFNNLTLDP